MRADGIVTGLQLVWQRLPMMGRRLRHMPGTPQNRGRFRF